MLLYSVSAQFKVLTSKTHTYLVTPNLRRPDFRDRQRNHPWPERVRGEQSSDNEAVRDVRD
jgi:hypothetical protein